MTDGLEGIIGTDLKLVDGNVKGIIKIDSQYFKNIKMIAKYGSLSSKIRKNALKICKLEDEYDIIKENVSRYACINSKEFLAECCSYKKTSKLAIVTRQLFLQELRGE